MAESKVEESTQDTGTLSKTKEQSAAQERPSIETSINKLAKYGGFDMLEASIEGVQNLNPERKARKKIFLTDNSKKAERADLKGKLQLWIDLLTKHSNVSEMVDA